MVFSALFRIIDFFLNKTQHTIKNSIPDEEKKMIKHQKIGYFQCSGSIIADKTN